MIEFVLFIIALKAIQFVFGAIGRKIQRIDIPINWKSISAWILISVFFGFLASLAGFSFFKNSIGMAITLFIFYLIIDLEEHWKQLLWGCLGFWLLVCCGLTAYMVFEYQILTIWRTGSVMTDREMPEAFDQRLNTLEATQEIGRQPTLDLLALDPANVDQSTGICKLTVQSENANLYSQANGLTKIGELQKNEPVIFVCRSSDGSMLCVITQDKQFVWISDDDLWRRNMTDKSLLNCGINGRDGKNVDYTARDYYCNSCQP